MCIILSCEPGCRPDAKTLDTCMTNNPDGAGLMWTENGMVQVCKGLFTMSDLVSVFDYIPTEAPLAIHMRIATSGGIDYGTCHPFPITDNLEALHATDLECPFAVMHNGVIATMPTDEKAGISDTVSFVRSVLYPMTIHGRSSIMSKTARMRIRRAAPNNRFCIMSKSGDVARIGKGWETVQRGVYASNDSWAFVYGRFGYTTHDINGCIDDPAYGDDYKEYMEDLETWCCGCFYYSQCVDHGPMCIMEP